MFCCACVCIFLFILYKVLDKLARIPLIGGYGDRYVFVTGCDHGFGNLFARRLDERGCHVFAGCFTEKGETELKKISSERLQVVQLNVAKQESVRKALDYVKSKLPKGKGLWAIMNNAGLVGKLGPTDWMNADAYEEVNSVNLLGLIDFTMTFLPLVKLERGRIVSTSSIFGRFALMGSTPYSVSKYGVEAFMDGLRRSMRVFGCKAILIEPGIHMTPMSSADNLSLWYRSAWEAATPEAKADYGEDYFNYLIGAGREKFMASGSKNVSDVVDAYEHAILGRFPRARYVVGKDATFFWLPLQALPECISDWFLGRADPDIPLPVAVRSR